jgi:hypothetical protein
MTYEAFEWRIQDHRIAAEREEKAYQRARCCESAYRHLVLAKMHRDEASKLEAVGNIFKLASKNKTITLERVRKTESI